MTPDEIVTHAPALTLADVHAALAYYFDHIEEVQVEMREEREQADEARKSHPSPVEEKMRQERLERPA